MHQLLRRSRASLLARLRRFRGLRLLAVGQFQFLNLPLQLVHAVFPEPRHLAHVQGRQFVESVKALGALSGDGARRHGEADILGAVDQLQDGAGGLVVFLGLDAEYPGVAAGALGVAFPEGAEELGEQVMGGLYTYALVLVLVRLDWDAA